MLLSDPGSPSSCPFVSLNLEEVVRLPNGIVRWIGNYVLTAVSAQQWCSQEAGRDAEDAPLSHAQAPPRDRSRAPRMFQAASQSLCPRLYFQEFYLLGFCLGSDLIIFTYELVCVSSQVRYL